MKKKRWKIRKNVPKKHKMYYIELSWIIQLHLRFAQDDLCQRCPWHDGRGDNVHAKPTKVTSKKIQID